MKRRNPQRANSMGRTHQGVFRLLLLVIGSTLIGQMIPKVLANGHPAGAPGYQEILQPATEAAKKEEPLMGPGPPYFIEVEETDRSRVVECTKVALEEEGERVFRWDEEETRLTTALRSIEPEELRRIAVTKTCGDRIRWVEGRAQLMISLSPGKEESTRIEIKARILAKGETSLPLMRPSDWWPVSSSGRLEGDIVVALEAHCQTGY